MIAGDRQQIALESTAPAAGLWLAFERYEALQEEHLDALRRGRIQSVMQWQAERERAFSHLQSGLDALGDLTALADDELAQGLTRRLGALLATENRLQKAVREAKRRIREQQAVLRKGKSAVRRMSSQSVAGPRPRFVSSMA